MIKKLSALLIVVALVAVACGDDEGAATTTTEGEAVTTTTAAPSTTDGGQAAGTTLETIRDRGVLICGTNETLPGFGFREADGSFSGFDVDYCRAIAAAVLGDATAVEFRPLTAAERFTALQTGEIDVLIRNTTWTQTRDTTLGANFAPTTFYDGQGVAALASAGFSGDSTIADLDGGIICTNAGTTTELNINEAIQLAGIADTTTVQTFEDFDQVINAFQAGSCDAITTDKSGLISRKATAEPASFRDDIVIFGLTLSKEPLGPMYRSDDAQWGDVVDWVVYATFIAEEKGITSGTLDDYLAANPDDLEAQRLFGAAEDELQTGMGLDADAFYNVVSQVGSYEEIYNRNLGPDTVFNVPRGQNSLWIDGGLFYPPPAR